MVRQDGPPSPAGSDSEPETADDVLERVSAPIQLYSSQLGAPQARDWLVKESLTLISPDYEANVIVTSESVDEDMDTQALAELNGQLLLEEFSGFQELSLEPFYLQDDRLAYVRSFTWITEDGAPVRQLQLYYVQGGRGYTATATTSTESFARFEKVFQQIFGGLVLGAARAS